MKWSSPKLWISLSTAYLAVLFIIVWFFNPDFSDMKSWALLVPLYLPLMFSVHLKHKNDENGSDARWEMSRLLLIFSGIFAVFKLIVDSLR